MGTPAGRQQRGVRSPRRRPPRRRRVTGSERREFIGPPHPLPWSSLVCPRRSKRTASQRWARRRGASRWHRIRRTTASAGWCGGVFCCVSARGVVSFYCVGVPARPLLRGRVCIPQTLRGYRGADRAGVRRRRSGARRRSLIGLRRGCGRLAGGLGPRRASPRSGPRSLADHLGVAGRGELTGMSCRIPGQ